jgi:hypothetical protein
MAYRGLAVMTAVTAMLLGMLSSGTIAAQGAAHDTSGGSGVKTIDNPDGGRIYLGALAGQATLQQAMGRTLHRVSIIYGDRPQLGRLVKDSTGQILAGFFTVTAKKQDGNPMTGLALVYAPPSGSAKGAVLIDKTDRFSKTVNSMFATLKKTLGKAPATAPTAQSSGASGSTAKTAASHNAPPIKSAPAQPLQRAIFPDGTGVIGLPPGWQMLKANMGDVTAQGPHGEHLRFGWTIPVIDPTNPQGRSLMGNTRGPAPRNFVAIPLGTEPVTAFKEAFSQLARKAGHQPPDIDITTINELPLQGGKSYLFYGYMNFHDDKGEQLLVGQMINTIELKMGTWQMTLFVLYGPTQAMGEEANTIGKIFPSWSRDNKRVSDMANADIQATIAQTVANGHMVDQYNDNSDRSTAGMSYLLRNQTVLKDTETGGHARTSDELAGALMDANPNRFEEVPESEYIKGLDY